MLNLSKHSIFSNILKTSSSGFLLLGMLQIVLHYKLNTCIHSVFNYYLWPCTCLQSSLSQKMYMYLHYIAKVYDDFNSSRVWQTGLLKLMRTSCLFQIFKISDCYVS